MGVPTRGVRAVLKVSPEIDKNLLSNCGGCVLVFDRNNELFEIIS